MYKRALDWGEPSEEMTAAQAAKLDTVGFACELSPAAYKWSYAGREAQPAKPKPYTQQQQQQPQPPPQPPPPQQQQQ